MPVRLPSKIDLRELVDLAQHCAADQHHRGPHAGRSPSFRPDSPHLGHPGGTTQGQTPKHVRPGRKGHRIDHYLLWADRNAATVASGVRNPIAVLAVEYGENRNYVRDTINDARHRHGLLTDPGQGRAGGRLTNKARQLLSGCAEDTKN